MKLKRINLIQHNSDGLTRDKDDKTVFWSESWIISDETMAEAIENGVELHLHESQLAPSWFSGIVIGWRPASISGKKAFAFRRRPDLDGYRTPRDRSGWGRERRFEYETENVTV